jgi:hypothetical protein
MSLAGECFLAAFAAGCSTAPPAPPAEPGAQLAPADKLQVLKVTTGAIIPGSEGWWRWVPTPAEMKPLPGAKCTARNDRGAWETTTPGTLGVLTGGGMLTVECRHPGYQTAKLELLCIEPGKRSMAMGAMMGAQLLLISGPAAIVALPAMAGVIAAVSGAVAVGAAAGYSTAGVDLDVCRYFPRGMDTSNLEMAMTPDPLLVPPPSPVVEGEDENVLRVATIGRRIPSLGPVVPSAQPPMGWGSEWQRGSRPEDLPGAKCKAQNDRGMWETTTPGRISVVPGREKLVVECSLPGYRTGRIEYACKAQAGTAAPGPASGAEGCRYFAKGEAIELWLMPQ